MQLDQMVAFSWRNRRWDVKDGLRHSSSGAYAACVATAQNLLESLELRAVGIDKLLRIVPDSPGDCRGGQLPIGMAHAGFKRMKQWIGRSLRKRTYSDSAARSKPCRQSLTGLPCALVGIRNDPDMLRVRASVRRKQPLRGQLFAVKYAKLRYQLCSMFGKITR